ncbi:SCO family protein [Lysobacter maris]|uniref:SCO family protein n=2 Tax=Marilutibacter maris TaxID=1605891 RepID=A0A507ZQ88_9GAMM|nr:SCO family protein [Lysobacter maris]
MRQEPAMNRFTRSLPVIVLVAVAVAALAPARAADPPLPSESVYQLSARLTDQDGRSRNWSGLQGKPRVISMFYTSCQYICPLIVESGKAIERQLDDRQRDRIGFVLISMDPRNDTPQALGEVVSRYRLDTRRWTLASPAPDQVRALAGVLDIRYRALADGGFNHTSALVLVDAQGRILARTEKTGSRPDPDFVRAVREAAH